MYIVYYFLSTSFVFQSIFKVMHPHNAKKIYFKTLIMLILWYFFIIVVVITMLCLEWTLLSLNTTTIHGFLIKTHKMTSVNKTTLSIWTNQFQPITVIG
jgi:hypothetical protein